MKHSLSFNLVSISILCTVFSLPLFGQSQEDNPKVGISASFQGLHSDIVIPLWISKFEMLAPGFSITSIKDAGTEIQFALIGRSYFNKNTVAPFIGGRLGTIIYSPSSGDALQDFVVGISGGGEYYISRNFSFGIEGQLNLGIADKNSVRYGNPGGRALSTGTSLFATIYF